MGNSAMIIRDGAEQHRLVTSHRDWGLLFGPFFNVGLNFMHTFGVYDNFTVAGGIPKGSSVTRRGRKLYSGAHSLLQYMERDADLLSYDYAFAIGSGRKIYSMSGVVLRGLHGTIHAQPKGYCYIELIDSTVKGGRVAEFIDLRIVKDIKTDNSEPIRIVRRKFETHWLETLPPLLHFLKPRVDKDLIIEHVDRVTA